MNMHACVHASPAWSSVVFSSADLYRHRLLFFSPPTNTTVGFSAQPLSADVEKSRLSPAGRHCVIVWASHILQKRCTALFSAVCPSSTHPMTHLPTSQADTQTDLWIRGYVCPSIIRGCTGISKTWKQRQHRQTDRQTDRPLRAGEARESAVRGGEEREHRARRRRGTRVEHDPVRAGGAAVDPACACGGRLASFFHNGEHFKMVSALINPS